MDNLRSFSCSVKGASHDKSGLPCQDASRCGDSGKPESVQIAVVADGHGSPQYFRSDVGARIAADAAFEGISDFIRQNPGAPQIFLEGGGKSALDGLAKHIISAWYTRVSDDETASPLTEDPRIDEIGEAYKNHYADDPERRNFLHAYGTTLIAAAVAGDYWFGLQIGDGKCVVQYENGEWDQPIPWDDNCFLNTTTSICDDDAFKEFRYWFGYRAPDGNCVESRHGADGQDKDRIIAPGSKPAAVFINTDGVDDSYPIFNNEKYLELLYGNVVKYAAAAGFEKTAGQMPAIAKKHAEQGSRDDVSIAGIMGDMNASEISDAAGP